jgi:hypothetical protein
MALGSRALHTRHVALRAPNKPVLAAPRLASLRTKVSASGSGRSLWASQLCDACNCHFAVSTHYHLADSHNHGMQAVQLSDADIRQLQDEVDMLRRENAALRQQLGKMALSDALAMKNGEATMVNSLRLCILPA